VTQRSEATGLSPRHRAIALALAEALLPSGRLFAGAGPASIERLERNLARLGRGALGRYAALLDTLELSTLVSHRARFSRLPLTRREALLESSLEGHFLRRSLLFALALPLESAHFDAPEFFEQIGCVYRHSAATAPARWMSQVHRADELGEEELLCDVAVIGTGAGGAVVAKELAEAGYAVVMLEEGEYRTRREFTGRPSDALSALYRQPGESYCIGNAIIPIPLGRSVGGTTTINSGTCFRTPDAVLERWREELGLDEFTPEQMRPYFERVERELQVAEAKAEYLGGVARVVARGCEALGWSHHALRRNAPDCDGQGVCCFGCPTDAKRSTNLSYVPLALEHSALLVTGLRADRLLLEGGQAVGIEGHARGSGRRLRVRAGRVVLACGALLTPAFLQRQGLLGQSKQLGRHLTIHPAAAMAALFDEPIRAFEAIPQGYCVDEFQEEGILLEGASLPFDMGATFLNLVGGELMEVMESYDRVASFAVMVSESRGGGRVRSLPGGRLLVHYRVTDEVLAKLQRGVAQIGRIFFAAGASRVFPPSLEIKEFRSLGDLERFEGMRLRARDLMLSAYHPLGTCRIGPDPRSSALDPEHRAHHLPGLYVCDGSAVPTSPMVNPQLTIMAMATRAAERIASRLS
jgi:choline dehydrogenase-like flavoprotein